MRNKKRETRQYKIHRMRIVASFAMLLCFIGISVYVTKKAWVVQAKIADVTSSLETSHDPETSGKPEETVKPPEFPEVSIKKVQKNGYLIQKPEIRIQGKDQRFHIHYQLKYYINSWKVREEGTAEGCQELQVNTSNMEDGAWMLSVWMTPKKEESEVQLEEQKQEWKFLLDETPPETVKFSVDVPKREGKRISNSSIEVKLRAEDACSGIRHMVYWLEATGEKKNEEKEEIKGEEGTVTIPDNFRGRLHAYAVDIAGNRGKQSETDTFIIDTTSPTIKLSAPAGFGIWYQEAVRLNLYLSDEKISSEIANVIYEVNGKQYSASNSSFQQLVIHEKSQKKQPVIIKIVVKDVAGNQAKCLRTLFIDGKNPNISVSGVKQQQISARKVKCLLRISDENEVTQAKVRVTWKDQTKKKKSYQMNLPASIKLEKELIFSQDGHYAVCVEAMDSSGRKISRMLKFTVDRSFPVIWHVQKLNHTYRKSFSWPYRPDKTITDFTSYTYQFYLDGMLYQQGQMVYEEGKHQFLVKAKDAAGNEIWQEAEFVIDRSEPVIIISGAKNGEKYKEKKELVFRVGKGEWIEEIKVNQQKLNLKSRQQEAHYIAEKEKIYSVRITATDLAGNLTEKKIRFRIEKDHSIVKTMVNPIKKYMSKQGKKDSTKKNVTSKKKENFPTQFKIIFGISVIFGIAVCYFIYNKRRKEKESCQ